MKTKSEEYKRKRNFIIYSITGVTFTADAALSGEEKIKEEDICKDVFKKNDLDDISYTKITNSSFKDLEDKLDEDIRVYFNASQDEVWNFNPILSAYMGTLVYSSVIVFVSENELEGSDGIPMNNDFFVSVVSGFIQACTKYAYDSSDSESEEASKKKPSAKSPMFNLDKITYNICEIPELREVVHVRPGKDKKKLDEFWVKNYVGKYIPDFVINDLVYFDDEMKDYIKGYVMMKPGVTTIYSPDTGKARIYFTQNTKEMFDKIMKKIDEEVDDLGDDPAEEEVKKIKEKTMRILYN